MRWRGETNLGLILVAIAQLKGTVEAAIAQGDEFAAEQAHHDLILAEWRMRASKRRLPQ